MEEVVGYALVEVGQPLRELRRARVPLGSGDVRVRVAGCGLCHTDLGFAFDGVKTRHPLPLVLGHEIAGVVIEADPAFAHLVGEGVVVPAVIPCGACDDCRAGAPMICARQIMPGNDRDGGFASEVVVPGRGLCHVPGAQDPDRPLDGHGLTLRHLAVVADAVSTPYQAIRRSGLGEGDLAIVIGTGGVGGYAVQIARARGAHVVAIDVSDQKLDAARAMGAGLGIDPRGRETKALRSEIAAWAKQVGAPPRRWTILECSGTAKGQETAFGLLVHGATLMVVGFTMDRLELRLSNLMAMDARALGNWGCAPELYPEIVALALAGQLDLVSFTEVRPLGALPDAFAALHHHPYPKRLVLAPEESP